MGTIDEARRNFAAFSIPVMGSEHVGLELKPVRLGQDRFGTHHGRQGRSKRQTGRLGPFRNGEPARPQGGGPDVRQKSAWLLRAESATSSRTMVIQMAGQKTPMDMTAMFAKCSTPDSSNRNGPTIRAMQRRACGGTEDCHDPRRNLQLRALQGQGWRLGGLAVSQGYPLGASGEAGPTGPANQLCC